MDLFRKWSDCLMHIPSGKVLRLDSCMFSHLTSSASGLTHDLNSALVLLFPLTTSGITAIMEIPVLVTRCLRAGRSLHEADASLVQAITSEFSHEEYVLGLLTS
jgi:hypothetical protein